VFPMGMVGQASCLSGEEIAYEKYDKQEPVSPMLDHIVGPASVPVLQ